MSIRKLSMLAVCIGFAGVFWGCDDSASNDANTASVCETGAKQCNGDTLQECKDNAWTESQVCEHGCDVDKKECKTEDEPIPGDKVCTKNGCKDDKTQKICAEDGMSFSEEKPCGDNEKCVDGACVLASGEEGCEAGKKECIAEKGKNAYRECADNAWVEKTCEGEQICSNGECVDNVEESCQDDSKKCSGTEGYVVCKDGVWGTEVTKCGEKQVCDATKNDCVEDVPPECEKDQTKCADEKSYFACVDGKWATDKTECKDGKVCDVATNTCEEKCKDNTTRCSADYKEILKCTKGTWGSDKKCEANQLCIDSECKETVCTPKQDICAAVPAKKDKFAMYHCNDKGQLGDLVEAETYCAGVCTADKTACLVCNEGAVNCTDKGVFQICQKNTWVDIVDCGENACIKDKAKVPGCKCQPNKDLRCNADKSKTEFCSALKEGEANYLGWVEFQDCAGKDKCEAKDNSASCKCGEKDAFSCNDNVLQLCNNGVLKDVQTCTEKETCNAEKTACVCKDGDRTCDGDNAKKCVGGAWVEEKCNIGETCNEKLGAVCVTKKVSLCDDKAPSQCYGPAVVKCKDGLYAVDEICSVACLADSHKPAKCVDACVKNTQLCSSDNKSVVNCSAEQVASTEPCKSDERCVEKMEGPTKKASCVKKECEEWSLLCDGAKVSICMNNAKKELYDCGVAGLACKDGMCVTKSE